ncbi:MAG: alpha/beta hydrolase [Gammaproteobacteria bacterium]|nr:alpha/beta hydrolase [Gammaproteobacteria bacterium]
MRLMWHVLGMLLAVYVGLALLLFLFQSRLVFYPQMDRTLSTTPAQIGLPFEEVNLKAVDGVELHGWYVPAVKPRGTILFTHGNAGNISHRLDYVAMFHRLGYNTLIFDYRGYGNSSGSPSEQGTYLDAESAWAYVTQIKHEPACRIALLGESLGGAVAAQLASRHRPAALVLASSFTSVPDLGQQLYPWLPVRWLAHIRYDTRAYLQQAQVPLLVAHSPQDEIIPYAHGQALYAAAREPKTFLELAGGHNDGFIFMREDWVGALRDFLDHHVGAGCGR